MKNKLLYLLVALLTVGSFWSCDDDSTEGMTRITYYAKLTLNGESTLYVDKGSSFTDPGFECTVNGEDVSAQVEVTSNVNTNQSGVYSVNYSIANADGFYTNAVRKVIVLDPNDEVEGLYTLDPNSYRVASATAAYGGAYSVLVIGNGDGTYNVDDLLGGWYAKRAGYGTNYAMQGVISVGADGTLTMEDSYVPGWGDSASSLEGQVDVANGSISYMIEYVGMKFYITMYKN